MTQGKINDVWNKTFGSSLAGKDKARRMVYKHEYGKETQFGWQVDHIKPSSKGGSDSLSNLQVLHWKTNQEKADKYPYNY